MQLSLLDAIKEGEALALEGLNRAVENANNQHPGWKDRCWKLFKEWVGKKPKGYTFLLEDFRLWAELHNKIEQPPSLRSFGFLSVKANKEGLIVGAGTAKVTNKKAHATPANMWRVA